MSRTRTWRLLSMCGLSGGIVYMMNQYGRTSLSSPVLHAVACNPPPPKEASSVEQGYQLVQPKIADMELKLVQVFFRHGARIPLRGMPNLDEVIIE